MSTETVKLIQGDAGPNINLTLKDKNTGEPSDPDSWDSIDLSPTLTAVYANIRLRGSTALFETTSCFIVGDGTDGQITYVPSAVLMAAALGNYEAEIYIDFNGSIQTMHDILRLKLTGQF